MESPAKKRSLFGFSGLWRTSTATATDSDATANSSTTPNLSLPARVESNASAPESPVKRASDTQLASRKILSRPHGPSSKLSQSFTAADLNEPTAAAVPKIELFGPAATPKRRPGDNPYKTPGYSTISHNTSNFAKSTNFSGSSTAPKNLFRSSSLYSRPGLPTFSPRVPPSTMTQSFPPNTPGKAPRGSTADISSRGFSQSTTTELFEMRIASPPRELTGEALAKQLKNLPQDPSRPGSIYADEFLAHLCPPELDDLQRRQFFCILDLRRLKYSADEVFVKKDWKINILNFAKEYEKNRSLIMLRYGLYEFKTVKASEAVKKEWKQKHGIPDSDDESEPTAIVKHSLTGSKRKAEDDLKSNDSVLTTSSSNGNKRARAPEVAATPAKNKRKAELVGSPDENQPSKLHKATATPQKAPSATKSVFESIVNKSSTPAAKPPSKSLFASSMSSKLPNGNGGRSVFESAPPSVAASNIFGHLSDTSKGSPNNDADGESETSSGEEEEDGAGESGDQEESQSEEASGADAPTPQFSGKTPATTNGTSSTSSDAGDSNPNQGRSLFDRITRGTDGQPVRHLPPQETRSPFAVSPDGERSASPAKEIAPAPVPAPAPAPVNNTWSTGTPIKFGGAGTSLFSSTAPKPAAINFGAPVAKKPESEEAPAQPATQNLFGAAPAKTEEPATKEDAPKPQPASSLFTFPAKPAQSASATPSLFGNTSAPTASTSNLFGSSTPAFGQANSTTEEKKESSVTPAPAPAPAASLFAAAKPAEEAKPSAFQSSTLFGNTTKTEEPKPQTSNLFGTTAAATPAAQPATTNLFGQTAAPTTSIFGATPAAAPAKEDASKSIFGTTPAATAKPIFNFGSSAAPAAEAAKPADKPLFSTAPTTSGSEKPLLFGATPSPAPETKPLFGTASSTAPTETKSLFGATTQPQEQKPLFGAAATTQTEAPKPIFSFGSTTSAPAPASGSIFGSQPTTTQPGGTGSIFGTGGSASFTFSAGGPSSGEINNPFSGGPVSAPSSFTFGSGGNDNSQSSSTPFMFGGGSTSFNAGSQPVPTISFGSTPSQPSTNMFSFGGSQSNPPSQSIFGSTLAPGGGTSTGTNSPHPFGGTSSLATTPATGTPEPAAVEPDDRGTNADGDDAPQEQISLTNGGPGEEDESVVHEIRAKAVKLVVGGDSDDESGSAKDAKKNPWKTMGVGPLRILKHKKTDAVRMLLRAEPRGHVALNKLVLPNFSYKVDPPGGKYVKLTTSTDDGKGLETWMLQVKTADAAKALAEALETNKKANEKK